MAAVVSHMTLPAMAMQLFVYTPRSKHITLEVEPTDRIEDVKKKIEDKEGIAPENMALYFAGEILEDGYTLRDYDIHRDSTLYMFISGQTMTVEFYVKPSYSVTIPQEIKLDEKAEISAENVVLDPGNVLNVYAEGEDGRFVLKQESNGASLQFEIRNGEESVQEGTPVLTVNPNESSDGSVSLSFAQSGTAKYAGNYSGTVNFRISVEESAA